ncbi:MAG: SRPBCC family protein [Myxococcota bacterium]
MGLIQRLSTMADTAASAAHVNTSRVIDVPASVVWDVITDTRTWTQWGPSVTAVETRSSRLGPDSRGRVKVAGAVWVDFVVCGWEEGCYWLWKVQGVQATGHRVEPLSDGRCRLIFEVPAVAAPYLWVCRRATAAIAVVAMDR